MEAVENRPNNPGNTCFCVLYMHLQSETEPGVACWVCLHPVRAACECGSAVMKTNTEQQISIRRPLMQKQAIRQQKPSLPVVTNAYDMTYYSYFAE